MKPLSALLCLLFTLALVPSGANAQTLAVAADSSLAEAVREIALGFEAARPGVKVVLDVGAAGALLERVARGGTADVLVSTDLETLAGGSARKLLVAGVPRVVASNTLVLVVPATRTAPLQHLAGLAGPGVQRLALGRPASVPLGRHAREAIDNARLWPAVQRKVVLADSVPQLLELLLRGEADAGIVYRTDTNANANANAANAAQALRVVQALHSPNPVRHAATVVAGSRQATLAREFVAALAAAPAREVWAQRGFGPP